MSLSAASAVAPRLEALRCVCFVRGLKVRASSRVCESDLHRVDANGTRND